MQITSFKIPQMAFSNLGWLTFLGVKIHNTYYIVNRRMEVYTFLCFIYTGLRSITNQEAHLCSENVCNWYASLRDHREIAKE